MAQNDTSSQAVRARLDGLSRGFRSAYLNYSDLTAQLRSWHEAFPEITRLTSLGTTEEGRDIWLLTLGRQPERVRPTLMVDANMHASELAGSSVALAVAEFLLELLATDEDGPSPTGAPELSPALRARLRKARAFVLPRISPDGAEHVLETHSYVRSVPRDRRANRQRPHFVRQDLDGDGHCLSMRVEDPTGEYVQCDDIPGLLLPRTLDDTGPFYKLYPEGVIENFDGQAVPTPDFLSDGEVDLNRNFPWNWAPEPQQAGAGSHPTSRLEARAVVDFAVSHPEIFAWVNLHTFGGVFIRPLGHAPDTKMPPQDLALYRQLEEWATEHTGYPMVSNFEQFTYEPDKPIHGNLSEWAYAHRGALSYVCELWDLFARLGKERPKRFVDHYVQLTREDMRKLARWDREENAGRVFRPWRPVEHPQLGPVEVGGLDPLVGLWNPPPECLPDICTDQLAMIARVASLFADLELSVTVQVVEPGVHCVHIDTHNRGYLGTHVLQSASALPHNEPLQLEVRPVEEDAGTLEVMTAMPVNVGHLDGWGRGRFSGDSALYMMASRGSTGRHRTRVWVRGSGRIVIRVGSGRVGEVQREIALEKTLSR